MDVLQQEIHQRADRAKKGQGVRLFHGRGQTFPGLEDVIVDYFAPVAHVILYEERPADWLEQLGACLRQELAECLEGVVVQQRFLPGAPSTLFWGRLPDLTTAVEDGLTYRLRLGQAQNIGFFPDMVAGRRWVRESAKGKRVLNLFAYTCSFSVAALAGGAEHVVNIDMNRGALELGRRNHSDNDIDPSLATFLPHDIFKSFGKLQRLGPFDLIVIDPPTAQGKSFQAEKDWARLLRRVPGLLNPGGKVLACLSAPQFPVSFLTDLFAECLPSGRLLERLSPGPDFPERYPDRGLKLLLYQLDSTAVPSI